jgi:hypothetical protein
MPDNVGYKQPPKHTRFQPGQSGNPNGRPKGTRNFKLDFNEELAETVADPKDKAPITKQRLIIRNIVAAAIGGDARAISSILAFWQRAAGETESDEFANEQQDSEIINDFAVRKRQRRAGKTSTPDKE